MESREFVLEGATEKEAPLVLVGQVESEPTRERANERANERAGCRLILSRNWHCNSLLAQNHTELVKLRHLDKSITLHQPPTPASTSN